VAADAAVQGDGDLVSVLNLRLACGTDAALLPVEVIDVGSRRRIVETVFDGDGTTIALDPGTYLVQTVTPDGVLISDEAEVSDDVPTDLLLGPSAAEPPAAFGDSGAGSPSGFAAGAAGVRWLEPFREAHPEPGGSGAEMIVEHAPREAFPGTDEWGRDHEPPDPGRLWGTLFVLESDTESDAVWLPVPWPDEPISVDDAGIGVRLSLPRGYLHALVLGGAGVESTVVVLPPAAELSVRVTVHPDGEPAVRALTPNAATETLLGYLTSGQLSAAGDVADAALDEAERLLYEKISDPVGAVVGALFLLRTRQLERLHHWPRNLADWHPWLPDAAVVRAAQLLTEVDPPRDELRDRLITAARPGACVYTDSLRRLHSALVLLSGEMPQDAEVRSALARVHPYARACDWALPLTTFPGTSPAEPVSESERLAEPPWTQARRLG
jgi:hypothetical protein